MAQGTLSPVSPLAYGMKGRVPTAQGTPSPTGVNPCKTPPTALKGYVPTAQGTPSPVSPLAYGTEGLRESPLCH